MNPMFYFFLALTAVLAATAKAREPVLDTNDDVLLGGGRYYVLPGTWIPTGGGLTLSSINGDEQCPLYIGLEPSPYNTGIPVIFSNWMSKVGFVPESENLNIEMDVAATTCVQSTYWWVAPSPMPTMDNLVATGPKPKPEEDSSKSFFQIKKAGGFLNGYKFSFCPEDEGCTDIGIARDEYGVPRLVLGSDAFPFVFMKASDPETSSKTMSII